MRNKEYIQSYRGVKRWACRRACRRTYGRAVEWL